MITQKCMLINLVKGSAEGERQGVKVRGTMRGEVSDYV